MDYYINGFGAIDQENPASFYDIYKDWKDDYLNVDLTFTGAPVSEALLVKVENILARIDELDQQNRSLIEAQALQEDGGIMAQYAEKVLQTLQPQFHDAFIDGQDPAPPHIQMMRKLKFKGISFVPEDTDVFACFIYCLDWRHTHKTLSCYYSENCEWPDFSIY
ncbi:hypothetical protein WJU16_20525 [Chitinophaga pollutisoli]|uniref:Uncharacterized protein n=1 Tax=Chitinophaga pollutisoli TaxID=3133966 RepID=A0ABZ2YKW1_9BACT